MDNFNMMPRTTETGRRQAIPRRSAMQRPSQATSQAPSIATFGGSAFTGFAIEEEDVGPDPTDWINNKTNHINLTRNYENVSVIMTSASYTN